MWIRAKKRWKNQANNHVFTTKLIKYSKCYGYVSLFLLLNKFESAKRRKKEKKNN